jgi:hypothetical protein
MKGGNMRLDATKVWVRRVHINASADIGRPDGGRNHAPPGRGAAFRGLRLPLRLVLAGRVRRFSGRRG